MAAAVSLLVAAAILVPGATRSQSPDPVPSSAGTAEPSTRTCGGKERPSLRGGECNLLTSVDGLRRVDPDSCVANNTDLSAATYGLICGPPTNSNFSSTERPVLYVYGYASAQSLNKAFDDAKERFNAAPRSATKTPGWEPWKLSENATPAGGGRVLGASEEGINYLIWTEDQALMMISAESKDADVAKIHAWWNKRAS